MRMDEVVDVCDRDWWLAEWFNWFILLLIRPMLEQWEVTIAWVALKHVGSVYVLSNSIEHIATGSVRCSYMDNGTSRISSIPLAMYSDWLSMFTVI